MDRKRAWLSKYSMYALLANAPDSTPVGAARHCERHPHGPPVVAHRHVRRAGGGSAVPVATTKSVPRRRAHQRRLMGGEAVLPSKDTLGKEQDPPAAARAAQLVAAEPRFG